MTKEQATREALHMALEALEQSHPEAYRHVIIAIKEALQSNEQVEPVKFPRNVKEYDEDWIIDPAFISRVKHSIDPETPWDFTPTMEQVEATLLALEVIPSTLFTHPPVPTAQPEHIVDVNKKVAQPEQEPVAGDMTAERAAYFVRRFKHEEKLLGPNEQAALDFVLAMLTTPPQRKPLTDEEIENIANSKLCIYSFARAIEAAHGIKELV